MNQENKSPAVPDTPPTDDQSAKGAKKNIDLKALKNRIAKFTKAESKHAAFLGIIIVLLMYVVMVWKISGLATAEPSSDDTAIVQSKIPKVDKKAVNQILNLEQNNTQVHSLFNQARNNPFQE
jgi:apolipoprotein N-acyltransferase